MTPETRSLIEFLAANAGVSRVDGDLRKAEIFTAHLNTVRSLAESTTDKLADLINEHAEAVVSSALDDTMPHASADASYRAGFADGLGHAIATMRGK